MKQIGIDQVKQLDSQLENLNSAIDANDNSIIELNTAIETNSNSIIELNNVLEGKQDTLIAGEGITIEDNVISTSGSSKSALQVTCSYNNDVLKGVAVVVDETTITTKSNGLATFTGLDTGTKTITASKNGFATNTSSKVIANSFEFSDIEMQPITLTFTITNSIDNPISGATITVGSYSATTNNEGIAIISEILDGTYTYTISALTYETVTGTIIIDRNNESESIVMLTAPINCYAAEAVTVDNAVKLNAGMGNADVDYNVYAANTSVTNVLTLDGLARSSASIGETAEVRVTDYQEKVITITTDQENADIQFNNGNDICTVNIVANMPETHNYLAFKRQSDNSIIYFKDRTYPFVPSDNTYPETSFTYYTYENNEMVEHAATTQSQTAGDTTYDGETLIIYSATVAVNGTWLRDIDNDQTITVENEGATITTSSYLTTPEAVIPTTNNSKFAMEKSNDYDVILVVGGAFITLANLQEIIVPNNTIIDTYITLKDGQPAKLLNNTYFKRYTISNDYTLRKVKLSLVINVSSKVTFTINGISKIIENTQLAQIDVYAGETMNYTVESEGYTTQSSSYNCPQYLTVKEQIVNITLS